MQDLAWTIQRRPYHVDSFDIQFYDVHLSIFTPDQVRQGGRCSTKVTVDELLDICARLGRYTQQEVELVKG